MKKTKIIPILLAVGSTAALLKILTTYMERLPRSLSSICTRPSRRKSVSL